MNNHTPIGTFSLLVLGGLVSSVGSAEVLPQADATALAMAQSRIESAVVSGSIASPGRVVVVYFTANDRRPANDHVARIRRIVEETARFYEQELQRNGFANRQMRIYRDAKGEVEVIDVVGAEPDANYGKPAGGKIRAEVLPVLRAKGIDPDKSVLLMFCNMMDYDAQASTISHHSPYYGGGSYLSGNAWQCDSEILDPVRLKDKTPLRDGEYGRITIGKHNSIFIGGVIHELGHALSLPHCRQRQDEQQFGTALMGSGNRTFGEQLRGEGKGTFLTQAHALRLAAHPVFNANVTATIYDRPNVEWEQLQIDVADGKQIRVRGQVKSTIPVHGIVAYFDPAGGNDYDATTATAIPDKDGQFAFVSGSLPADKLGQLRLVTCHVNGATTSREFNYRTNRQAEPDLSALRLNLDLQPMLALIKARQFERAQAELERAAKADPALKEIGQRVLDRFAHWKPIDQRSQQLPADIPADVKSIPLSHVRPTVEKVGWIRPAYDCVPDKSLLLSVDGDYFAHGIYAHAPAQHQYQLGGQWSRLTGTCGLQSGNGGKVDFEIQGDGKTLWSAKNVSDGEAKSYDIDLSGVQVLNLLVTDGGNGNNSDWGIWIEPTLSR